MLVPIRSLERSTLVARLRNDAQHMPLHTESEVWKWHFICIIKAHRHN